MLLLAASAASAQQDKAPVVTAPPPPEELTRQQEGPAAEEPEVTIVRRGWATIEEYSYGGRVYAVKIKPAVGAPYYLYDSDGDGSLETRRTATEGMPELNQWKILSW